MAKHIFKCLHSEVVDLVQIVFNSDRQRRRANSSLQRTTKSWFVLLCVERLS